jgi:uncharacterized membrane protein YozB (DUF420 family)
MIESLPHINASLNLTATLLLVAGYLLIRSKRETAHKTAMLSAFLVSCVFLGCYLAYHANVGSKKFPAETYGSAWYGIYLLVLLPHIALAATVPFLGIGTIFLGLTNRREKHRKLARITFPVWLYVSVTGVLVYLFLYWWFPPVANAVPPAG